MDDKFKSEEPIEKEPVESNYWASGNTTGSASDYLMASQRQEDMLNNKTNLMSDQENLKSLGRSNKSVVVCGLFIVLLFTAVVFWRSKDWYTSLCVGAGLALILLFLSVPWIIASIRKVPIYSNLPTTYWGGSTGGTRGKLSSSYGSFWWLDALFQSLKPKK